MADMANSSVVSSVRLRWIRWTVTGFTLLVVLAGTGIILRLLNERASERDCERAISWVGTSYSAPGTYADLSLPIGLRGLSEYGGWSRTLGWTDWQRLDRLVTNACCTLPMGSLG